MLDYKKKYLMKLITIFLCSLLSFSSFATHYYMSKNNHIISIDQNTFNQCNKIFYRKSGKTGLSHKHKKGVVKATLKGELVNDINAVKNRLIANNGSCSHSSNKEIIQ